MVRMVIVFAALGIASILYGISVMLLHSGTHFFAVWYALGAFFLACAWATHAHALDHLPVAVRNLGAIVLAIVLSVFLFTQGLIASQFAAKADSGLDYVVVLGAQVRPDSTPSAVLHYRLDAALDYALDNPAVVCIVSGGQGPNEPTSEAACMKDYLVQHGLPPERILVEDRSENTMQNISNSLALVDSKQSRVGVVTNNFHVYRALAIARKAGLEHASGIAAYSTPFYLPNNMLREGMGIVKDYLVGNL